MWFTPKDHKALGAHLAEVRTKAGVSQDELAKRLKKPQSFISSYEGGQRRLDLLELIKVIGAIGADAKKVVRDLVDVAARLDR